MDPITPGPEEYGHTGARRPPRDPLTADFGPSTPAPARTAHLVTGDLLLTVNPVDGSEIEPCPPARRPGSPRKRGAAERAEAERAARPPVPPGPAQHPLPLLERQEVRERLVRLLARGRTVRLTGPGGSGRSALLDLVADDCHDLAPDGVVRLCGIHRTAEDLLHDLFHTVHDAPGHRPERLDLRAPLAEIGAVVVVDDIEFGGAELDELLEATPECAFLFSATPDVPAPTAEADVEEVFLGGLDRAGGVDILERAAGRVLTEEEANWAGDLWFESEGLPLRFVQAGALLRQRDQLRADSGAVDEYGVFEDVRPVVNPVQEFTDESGPLPSLGEAAAPAPLLASRLSAAARATLRFAVALGGEVPHQAHLPALVGDTHADAALGELAGCGLVSPAGSRYRLAAGVRTQLEAAGYGDDAPERARTAARHYAWWAGHPSVTPERVSAEADAVLAALAAVVPPVEGDGGEAVRLARTAAPAFAAALRWSAWERALRSGAQAALHSGEVPEQAYFHHELGILALCGGRLDRARAELEASTGLRGALADKRGAVAGRRALALVADRAGELPGLPVPVVVGEPATEPVPALPSVLSVPAVPDTLVSPRIVAAPPAKGLGIRRIARRNLVAAGSGALLAAVLGTVVTLGMTSHDSDDKNPAGRADDNPATSQDAGDPDTGQDQAPAQDPGTASRPSTGHRATPAPSGTYAGTDTPARPSTSPTANPTGPTGSATGGAGGGGGSGSASTSPTPTRTKPSSPPPTKPTPPTTPPTSPTGSPTPPPPTGSPSDSASDTSSFTKSASGAASPTDPASDPAEQGQM
ncbi:ATP-binding protein [Streptomyces sp. SUK 48]|uniref:ATP-binding protein n=1 Tax=Streptomyces sp. SUK 48 TaxID=2582831 RepID=UPI00129B97D2|nr:ATP-binding protein [Streptomyces sp. SUK 48]